MRRIARTLALVFAALLGIVLAASAVLLATALYALRAAPGDWSVRAAAGPLEISLSVPALIRVATHPLGIRLLDGQSITTAYGMLSARAGARPATLIVRCAPCRVDSRLLAAEPLHVAEIEASIEHGESNQLHGELRAGRVRATWQGRLALQSADIELKLADVPVADLVALFGTAVPEAARARIEGRAGAVVRLALPSRRYAIEPRLDGLAVEGLGTEALLAASPAPTCARLPRGRRAAAPFGPWLPKAVIAAEDQRFFEHAGYDLAEMAAAWSSELPAGGERRRGASTISQQLAKLLYTGDERSAARKVRELLYAAELDGTLGKARVLQLYLSVAPWGDGQCGGEAAALHYFGKHAAALDAAEAVWLASLLRNPEAELERSARGVDLGRLTTIAGAMRPMSRIRREDLQYELGTWTPPPVVEARRALRAPAS
ncbi:MAG: transglycosylase domain-containing protein [Burkholderiales bacterium]|nr:transglycosylase domain-containing protein [Burkholderiales bacterium]